MPEPLPSPTPHTRFHTAVVLPLSRLVAHAMFAYLGPVRVTGKGAIPARGPLLILCNHLSDMDPIVVQHACPRPIHFMAKQELFEMGALGPVIRQFKAFPVNRGEPDRAALRHALELLKIGETVCVFPEGRISEDGELLPLLPGAALLARQPDVATIVCRLGGTQRMMPYGTLRPRRAHGPVTAEWSDARTFGKSASADEILAWAESLMRSGF